MRKVNEVAAEFLATKRIAVTGVSRDPAGHGANVVYDRLRQRGYEVFAVNPNADEIGGELCYHDLKSIPDGVGAVVIGTRVETAEATMRECVELGIPLVWMHRSFGPGSVSPAAAEFGRKHGVTVIAGGCPLMFPPASDPGHRVIGWVCAMTGVLPRRV
jgi:predicted CoA-binding protein